MPRCFRSSRPTRPAPVRRAFTLLELIVSVGIIFLLASLVIVALGGVREGANRTESANALRQMMVGYALHSAESEQRLMPGFVSGPTLKSLGINPRAATGASIDPDLDPQSGSTPAEISDASAYVWRLAPYLDDAWKTMLVDYRSAAAESRFNDQVSRVDDTDVAIFGPVSGGGANAGLARLPSFGMNSIFVGGDELHGGAYAVDRNPWTGSESETLAATRLTEAKNPARLIVFAPSMYWGYSRNPVEEPPGATNIARVRFGSPELRAPYLELLKTSADPAAWTWDRQQWEFSAAELANMISADAPDSGVPIARWGKQLPAAHLDGSVTIRPLAEYSADMRFWSAKESGDYKTQ